MDLAAPMLALAADIVDDIERVRIANENRLRQLTRSAEDSDGETRGFGLDESHPDVARLAGMVEMLANVETSAIKTLERQMKTHPLGAWVSRTRGVGLKQAARLLASIGDPSINSATGQPRTVSALWAYSGLHTLPGEDGDNIAAKRRRGVRSNWSANAKTRAYLIATSCLKQLAKPCHAADFEGRWLAVHYDACACSPYRTAYDKRRAHTSSTHPDWPDGHSHNDALRYASKCVLKDLWRAAREIHAQHESNS